MLVEYRQTFLSLVKNYVNDSEKKKDTLKKRHKIEKHFFLVLLIITPPYIGNKLKVKFYTYISSEFLQVARTLTHTYFTHYSFHIFKTHG